MYFASRTGTYTTPVGVGRPGMVGGPGSGVGPPGPPVLEAADPQPASTRQPSTARLDLIPGSLESADLGLLFDRDRERLGGERSRDLERGLLLPGAPQV